MTGDSRTRKADASSAELARLQQIMSRTGSFPLSVANDLILAHSKNRSIIFDPFCGKGTTLLAARQNGHMAYGMDVAPEAVICSAAKLLPVRRSDVEVYIRSLRRYDVSIANVPPAVRTFFHDSTLKQILAFRNQLRRDIQADGDSAAYATTTLALLLGILHGHASYSLSLPSAHAYAMAPAYVARFAAARGLTPPKRDVREALLRKATLTLPASNHGAAGYVRRGSALECATVFPELINSVDLVLTSPPYLAQQTYPKDNWLRLWLLGYDYKALQSHYIATGSIQRYGELMRRTFHDLALLMRSGGTLICVAGDVRARGGAPSHDRSVINTAEIIYDVVAASGLFRMRNCLVQSVRSSARYLHALNGTNGHSKRDLIERIFVAERHGPA